MEAAEARFLISADHVSELFIDSRPVGRIDSIPKVFDVFPGEHYISAKSIDSTWAITSKESVQPDQQKILELKLLPTDVSIGVRGTYKDPRNNYVYKTITINGKTWLGENLQYNNGRSYYYCKMANKAPYGMLYIPVDAKSAVPPGWHLPTMKEWQDLVNLYPASQVLQALSIGGKSNFDLMYAGSGIRSKTPMADCSKNKIIAIFWVDAPIYDGRNDRILARCFSFDKEKNKAGPSEAMADPQLYTYGSIRCVKD